MTTFAEHTTIRLGGPVDDIVEARTEEELLALAREIDPNAENFILGGGSNVLIADEGVAGKTLKIATHGVESIKSNGGVFRAQAGHSWDQLVEKMVGSGMAGIECLAGIPGTVGGTPIQNVGAYGQEISEVVVAIDAYDLHRRSLVRLTPLECGFGYRTSRFKSGPGRFIVVAVEFGLRQSRLSEPIRNSDLAARLGVSLGDRVELDAVPPAVLSLRREKGMVLDRSDIDTCSLGSFFTNPSFGPDELGALKARVLETSEEPVPTFPKKGSAGVVHVPAAWLIERAGFHKGYGAQHGIGLSSKHVLALVNRGGGSTAEAVDLARRIAQRVWKAFGVMLQPEPDFIGHTWVAPVHVA